MTKKNKRILLWIAIICCLVLIIWACIALFSSNSNSYRLQGRLKGGENKILVLLEMEADGPHAIDTIYLSSKGKFSHKAKLKEPSLFVLQSDNDYMLFCPSKKETINIEGDFYDLALSTSVTGSKESEDLRLLIDRQKKTGMIFKAIQDEWDMAAPEAKDSLLVVIKEKFAQLHTLEKEFLKKYIKEHEGSLTTIPALYETRMGNPVFSPKKDIEVYEQVLKGLEKTLPSNKHTQNLRNFIQKVKSMKQKEESVKE